MLLLSAVKMALDGCVFILTAKLSCTQAKLTKSIKKAGGVVGVKVCPKTTHLLASEEGLKSSRKKAEDAKAKGVPVVTEAFLEAAEAAGSWRNVKDPKCFLASAPGSGGDGGKADGAAKDTSRKRGARRAAAQDAAADGPEPRKKRARRGRGAAASAASAGPLDGKEVAISGRLHQTKAVVTRRVEDLGGEVVNSVHDGVDLVIVPADAVSGASVAAKISAARDHDIPCVALELLDDVEASGSLTPALIAKHKHDMGTGAKVKQSKAADKGKGKAAAKATGKGRATAKAKVKDRDDDEEEDKSRHVKTVAKGRIPLDDALPDDVKRKFHVLDEGGVAWDAMLNQTNVANNNNKFYLLQLLASDSGGQYATWFRWGRVGHHGQQKLSYGDKASCQAMFCTKFEAKTLNSWPVRGGFVPRSGKYTLLHRKYGDEQAAGKSKGAGKAQAGAAGKAEVPKSALDPRVQDLVSLICDVNMMQRDMVEIGYDAQKMPLGQLSDATIREGYAALKAISEAIDRGAKRSELVDLSSVFYTYIPHDFGFKNIRGAVIEDQRAVRHKLAMMQALSDVVVAMRMLDEKKSDLNPVDDHYKRLKCNIAPLDHDSPEFKTVCDYVAKSKGPTHRGYRLEVEDVYEVEREGEVARFNKGGAGLPNHRLLWHGSRLSNYAGILSQGLRIAPPEAPVTGYMFGKGVYFADRVTKSANYCATNSANPTGLMLLCDVALGNMNETLQANYHADKLPPGKHSTWGVGTMRPDPKGNVVLDDGTEVPMGKTTNAGPRHQLLYNEFVVYNLEQIRMRYLVKLKFHYG